MSYLHMKILILNFVFPKTVECTVRLRMFFNNSKSLVLGTDSRTFDTQTIPPTTEDTYLFSRCLLKLVELRWQGFLHRILKVSVQSVNYVRRHDLPLVLILIYLVYCLRNGAPTKLNGLDRIQNIKMDFS